jgi:hypothetical protein
MPINLCRGNDANQDEEELANARMLPGVITTMIFIRIYFLRVF